MALDADSGFRRSLGTGKSLSFVGLLIMSMHSIFLLIVAFFIQASTAFANNSTTAMDRLKSCDPNISLAAAKEILADQKTPEEPFKMFSPAYVLYQHGMKDEAVFWFYAAQLRARYQAAIKGGDHGQVLSIFLMTVGPPINNYAFQDVARLNRILDKVLAWDKTTPNPLKQEAISEENKTKIEKVYSGFEDLKVKLAVEKDDLENKAKLAAPEIQLMHKQPITPPCRKDAQ